MAATTTRRTRPSRAARRTGYAISIALNVVGLVVVNNLLDWGWFSFLTDDFNDVLPFVNASIVVSIVVDTLSLWRDPPWFRSVGQVVEAVTAMAVAVRTWQVFPFDVSDGWATFIRVILVLAMVGITVGAVSEVARLARSQEAET